MIEIFVNNKETTDEFSFKTDDNDFKEMIKSYENVPFVFFGYMCITFDFFIDFKDFKIGIHEFRKDLTIKEDHEK